MLNISQNDSSIIANYAWDKKYSEDIMDINYVSCFLKVQSYACSIKCYPSCFRKKGVDRDLFGSTSHNVCSFILTFLHFVTKIV